MPNGRLCVRMLFAGAREGHWPHIFSMIHIRRHTPLPAVLLLVRAGKRFPKVGRGGGGGP